MLGWFGGDRNNWDRGGFGWHFGSNQYVLKSITIRSGRAIKSNYCQSPSAGFHQCGHEGGVGGATVSRDDWAGPQLREKPVTLFTTLLRIGAAVWGSRVSSLENLHFHLRLCSTREKRPEWGRERHHKVICALWIRDAKDERNDRKEGKDGQDCCCEAF